MFKDKKELAQALLDGRKFVTPQGGILYFDPTAEGSPFRYQRDEAEPRSEPMVAGWSIYAEVVEHIEPITVWVNFEADGHFQVYRKERDARNSALPAARRAVKMQLVMKS